MQQVVPLVLIDSANKKGEKNGGKQEKKIQLSK
jgi:hypothetical protein